MKQHDRVIGPGGNNLIHIEVDSTDATKGNARVQLSNVEGTTGQNVPSKAIYIGGRDGNGQLQPLSIDSALVMQGQTIGKLLAQAQWAWNESTFDAVRGNTQGTLLASAARTATTTSPDQTNYNSRGIQIMLQVTAASGTGGLIPRIYAKDPLTGVYYALNPDITAILANGYYVFEVYPGSTGTTSPDFKQRIAGSLPRTYRIQITHGDTSSYTYSVAQALIL